MPVGGPLVFQPGGEACRSYRTAQGPFDRPGPHRRHRQPCRRRAAVAGIARPAAACRVAGRCQPPAAAPSPAPDAVRPHRARRVPPGRRDAQPPPWGALPPRWRGPETFGGRRPDQLVVPGAPALSRGASAGPERRRSAAQVSRRSPAGSGAVQASSSASTLAAWPSARTLYQARRMMPSGPIRNVDRITPTVFLPYRVFSP